MRYKDSVLPWHIGRGHRKPMEATVVNQSDPNLLNRLRKCADIDIYMPRGLRHHGYCEDAAAYAKYLGARILPEWVQTIALQDPNTGRTLRYHEICPTTPTVFFNHYYDTFLDESVWLAPKKMILMPNIEMYELQAEQYRRPDYILCKTAVCARYLKNWFRLHGNPRGTKVIYTRHTTTDLTAPLRAASRLTPKNFSDVRFIHTAGTSVHKVTKRVFDCWLKRRDLPPVDVYVNEGVYKARLKKKYHKRLRNSPNIRLHLGKMNASDVGRLVATSPFFLCTSIQEGYGHYINQARAAGGVIITPDVPPMNELVTTSSGVLVRAEGVANKYQFLGGAGQHPLALRNVTGLMARFTGKGVCDAVEQAIHRLDANERARRAERARQQYLFDTVFLARAMESLRTELQLPPLSSTGKIRSPFP